MEIVFLLGNGFDLNFGMETKYQQFYKHYRSIKSDNPVIQKLKDEIDGNLENWSDLELALGKYTLKLNSKEEFNLIYEDIEDSLAEYLEAQENKFNFDLLDGTKLYNHFAFPEEYLSQSDKNIIKEFKRSHANSQWNIDIMTFNYTKLLEKLINYEKRGLQINNYLKVNSPSAVIQDIIHIHGYTDHRMVLGVNDLSQVLNTKFHSDIEVIENLVKPLCNKAQKHTFDKLAQGKIVIADLICIFGSSIGDTDNFWWEFIGNQMKRNCKVIIFEKGEIIPPRRPQKGRIAERQKIEYFLNKTNLTDNEKESIRKNIFIGLNTNIFNPNDIKKS